MTLIPGRQRGRRRSLHGRRGKGMFIVWRKRAVTTDRPVELFVDWWDAGGKRQRFWPGDLPAWKRDPIFCRHRGPGRVTWTPLLVHAERINGNPRQRLLRRQPAVRTCCIADGFLRAAWWQAINDWARFAHED